jgi:gas vesicle protein
VPALTALVFTEDSSRNARQSLINVLKKMFRQVDADASTHENRIRFVPPEALAERMAIANNWNSRRNEAGIRELCRTVATELLKSKRHFVFMHVDADVTWANTDKSLTLSQWRKVVHPRVRTVIAANRGEAEASEAIDRLLLVGPHYSIEAWAYQHTDKASSECCGHHLGTIEGWRNDRRLLDEIYQPKEAICLSSHHNAMLTGAGYPADDVREAGKSWATTVNGFLSVVPLRAALRATWEEAQW